MQKSQKRFKSVVREYRAEPADQSMNEPSTDQKSYTKGDYISHSIFNSPKKNQHSKETQDNLSNDFNQNMPSEA